MQKSPNTQQVPDISLWDCRFWHDPNNFSDEVYMVPNGWGYIYWYYLVLCLHTNAFMSSHMHLHMQIDVQYPFAGNGTSPICRWFSNKQVHLKGICNCHVWLRDRSHTAPPCSALLPPWLLKRWPAHPPRYDFAALLSWLSTPETARLSMGQQPRLSWDLPSQNANLRRTKRNSTVFKQWMNHES